MKMIASTRKVPVVNSFCPGPNSSCALPDNQFSPIDPDGEFGYGLLQRLRRGERIKDIYASYAAMRATGDPQPTIFQLADLAKHLDDPTPPGEVRNDMAGPKGNRITHETITEEEALNATGV
jgi:hypothetical protein